MKKNIAYGTLMDWLKEKAKGDDQEIATELMDILYDYEWQSKQLKKLNTHYERVDMAVIEKTTGKYKCPVCGTGLLSYSTFCRKCGKRVRTT